MRAVTYVCAVCAESFTPSRSDAVTCSARCRRRKHLTVSRTSQADEIQRATDVLTSLTQRLESQTV